MAKRGTRGTAWLTNPDSPGMSVGVKEGTAIMDSEGRFAWEPYGYHMFAFWPVKCRNGKWRWFRSVERHRNGTYSLSRGAW